MADDREDLRATHRLSGEEAKAAAREVERGPTLLVFHGERAEVIRLEDGQSIVIGRAEPAGLVVADASLSRSHARLERSGSEIWVEDLGSTNGTRLNGDPLVERTQLRAGDEMQLGSVIAELYSADDRAVEPSGALLTHERFIAVLEEELARARYFGRTVAMIDLRFAATGEPPIDELVARLRPVDRGGRYSRADVELVMPELSTAQAVDFAQKIRAASAGVAVFPESATSAEALVLAAREAASGGPGVRSAPVLGARTLDTESAVYESASMRAVFETASRLSRSIIPILIQGETGTGKELVARAIHFGGPRASKPLCALNCGAIPPQLLESHLFGHEQGAFTGAVKAAKGVFESANGGTVFLDEIGELPLAAQAALLRVLETKRFVRVGSMKEITVDVRIVAATHRDLGAMCAAGTFRDDLFYRLNAMTLAVPPLRERPEDVPPLAHRFLELANRSNGTHVVGFDQGALELLCTYAWPGNVRELRNAVERAVVIARGDRVSAADLPDRMRSSQPSVGFEAVESVAASGASYKEQMRELEAKVLLEALRAAGGNQAETARRLGLPRRTLVEKIRQHGLKRGDYTAK